jgi:hypothetical protein
MELRHAAVPALTGWYLLISLLLSGCLLSNGNMVTCQSETASCQSGPQPSAQPSPAQPHN